MKIYPSITTTNKATILDKIQECRKLKLKEVCFFPTDIGLQQRQQLYKQLENSPVKRIPLVHLRDDMDLSEVEYLANKFRTEIFNIHPQNTHRLKHDLSKYRDRIYVENLSTPYDREEITQFAGICIDFTHLEIAKIRDPEEYKTDLIAIQTFPCGCAHIGALRHTHAESHILTQLSELDYLKTYPKSYFPKIIAIELENSIQDQLQVKQYIETLLT